MLPGVYELGFSEHLYLTASERRRNRQSLDIPEREREFRFWLDDGALIGTLKGSERDMHFIMQAAPLPAEDFRSFELAGEIEFTADDPAAEAAVLAGCPFEQLPRLVGETEADAEPGAQRTIRLIHLGEIGLIGTLETRLQTGLRIEAMHWDSLALTPQ
ncbi:MAG: hypothetical protein JJT95_07865 [Pararhodobacter sp.]|nr:hypothetical protein [Pararhodobacter sp.]